MNTSTKDKCSRCGAAIPAASTEELCPACLMSGALEPTGSKTETNAMEPRESLSRHGPPKFPCDFGGYRLLGTLGRGGMGVVYEAEQLATGRRVALKMLDQELDSPEMRQRFLREGRLAARVSHPNSLYIFGSEEIEGLPAITMEIAGCGTLKDELKKRGPLPVTEAVDAMLDVISGLESAFANGVLHRDIKPSNCFVCPDGSVKVGDFGLSVSTLARTDTFVTTHGKILGTPAYASPEQLRGDTVDVRADVYSVGATLFTLLTDQAPFEGANAVQVVANAVNQKPRLLTELRKDVPPGLERIVDQCLAKEPGGRFPNYAALRDALLPFSSKEPEPASLKIRVAAGWIDYLIAFLVPYVILMLSVGAATFHNQPFVERTLYSWRYYIAFLTLGFLYFSIVEGIWGAGLGKRFKGLRVVRTDGRAPGLMRALSRVVITIGSIEAVRIPLLLATFFPSSATITGMEALLYIGATNVCAWIPVLLTLRARRENGFATVWDRMTGTRVVVNPKGVVRPSIEPENRPAVFLERAELLGPFQVLQEIVPGKWLAASDPVLRRPVWLLRNDAPELPLVRRDLARPGRMRWLQRVTTADGAWDAFEATEGIALSQLVEGGRRVPWSRLRHWLHDLASELWDATGDQSLPTELSLDHVWITAQGRAVLLDQPWPGCRKAAERVRVGSSSGQQRFLNAVAALAESTSLPLHARPVLQNLREGRFEKLSFLAGTLRGLLDKPAEINEGIRAGSIFMLPLYVWILIFVGSFGGEIEWYGSADRLALIAAMAVLGGRALFQLLELPFRTTCSHSIYRIAVVNAKGERATAATLLLRWAIVWLPLLPAIALTFQWLRTGGVTFLTAALVLLLGWLGAAVYAVLHPNQGLHDRLADTWVVRR